MACIKGPNIVAPVLPAGISISAPKLPMLPTIGLCCKLPLPFPSIPNGLISLPLPGAIVSALNQTMEAVHAALDAVQFSCPAD